MGLGAIPDRRGCGTREAGGVALPPTIHARHDAATEGAEEDPKP
jgi:hypothetical protein